MRKEAFNAFCAEVRAAGYRDGILALDGLLEEHDEETARGDGRDTGASSGRNEDPAR